MQRLSRNPSSSTSRGRGGRGRGGRGRGRGRSHGKFQDTTTHMPTQLLEELNAKDPDTRTFTKPKKNGITRKEQRKQMRQQKKQQKAVVHSHKRQREEHDELINDNNNGTTKQQPAMPNKKQKSMVNDKNTKNTNKSNDNSSKSPLDETEAMREQIVRMAARDPSMYARLRKSGLVEDVGVPNEEVDAAEALEEQMLRYYEKQLKIKKVQKLPKSFGNDGLDFLLEDITVGSKRRQEPTDTSKMAAVNMEMETVSEQSNSEDDTESEEGEQQYEDAFDLDIASDISEEDDDDDDDEDEEEEEEDSEEKETEDEDDEDTIMDKEDTVVKPTLDTANTAGKYIPPHLRQSNDARSAQLIKLRRQIQGQLNRLSEANIETIITEIEALYRDYPRRDVTDTMTDLILNAIGLRAHLTDNFVVVNAALVASLYGIIGIEFGAHFIQTLVERFDKHHAELLKADKGNNDSDLVEDNTGKECANFIVLLTELYNFQVVSCVLLYDFIRNFIQNITESNVDLLTRIIRLSGVQLRQEDPNALKEIVLELQSNLARLDPTSISSRTKFMIEMIQDLKNNKVKKRGALANQANATKEIITTLKKFIGNMNKKRHVVTGEPFNVSLTDIRSVKTKGKWWLVGASWVGNQVDGNDDDQSMDQSTKTTTMKTTNKKSASDQLLALARKQNMNTDIRRSIFVIIMSSEDYTDAFDRLMKLGLKEVQEREIARVLLHCCGQEKVFNPYYVLVAERVCNYKHGFKVTFQYALWDFLRELGEDAGGLGSAEARNRSSHEDGEQVPIRRIVNIAKFYGWLMGSNTISLTVLKTLTFTRIQSSAQTFFRVLFANLFLRIYTLADQRQDVDAITRVFSRATVVPNLAEGIRFFLHYFMRKVDFLNDAQDAKTVTWSIGIARNILKNSATSAMNEFE